MLKAKYVYPLSFTSALILLVSHTSLAVADSCPSGFSCSPWEYHIYPHYQARYEIISAKFLSPSEGVMAYIEAGNATNWWLKLWPIETAKLGGSYNPTYNCDTGIQVCTEEWALHSRQTFTVIFTDDWQGHYGRGVATTSIDVLVFGNRKITRDNKLSLSITPSLPLIPTESRVENKKVQTKSTLALTLSRGAEPASGLPINLASTGGDQDTIKGPNAVTDTSGKTTAEISTRNQPGTSIVTATNSNIYNAKPGKVVWFPAKYESQFLVTCYVLSRESDFSAKTTRTNVCGLPPGNTYRKGFLNDVQMQGSGLALDGTFIHYSGHGCYNTDSCARTATNRCATPGTTIAVDKTVIPYRSSVQVAILGQRAAQDTGSGIIDYHIDDYMGPIDRSVCQDLGHRTSDITFLNY